MGHIVSLAGVSKKYRTQDSSAVRDISFSVDSGEIVGILGPNGAGKSTLIKMLLGVICPTNGEIAVLGKDPLRFSKRDKAKLGVYLGGKSNLIFHLPVIDSVKLFQSIYKVPLSVFEGNLARYGNILQCNPFLHQRVATLSLGQKLRAELLCILIYEPQILILDEPTLGLDIEGKRQFRDMLHDLVSRQGLSVLITTHDVNDMQKLCSRIIMICRGEKVMDLTSAQFDALLEEHCVILTDADLGPLPEGGRFLERENDCNRYLLPISQVELVKQEIQSYSYRILKQEIPRLEDILYEYYR